jgi:hypothetical protein
MICDKHSSLFLTKTQIRFMTLQPNILRSLLLPFILRPRSFRPVRLLLRRADGAGLLRVSRPVVEVARKFLVKFVVSPRTVANRRSVKEKVEVFYQWNKQ